MNLNYHHRFVCANCGIITVGSNQNVFRGVTSTLTVTFISVQVNRNSLKATLRHCVHNNSTETRQT